MYKLQYYIYKQGTNMTENERQRNFVRLAEVRAKKALHYIHLLSNLSNRRYYHYDKAQVKKIVNALKEATRKLEEKFDDEQVSIDDFKL